MKRLIIALISLTVISLAGGLNTAFSFTGWSGNGDFYHGGHMMGYGYMGWTMVFFWIALLVMMVIIIRWLGRMADRNSENSPENALEILKKRLARGEIDIDEYIEKKKIIE